MAEERIKKEDSYATEQWVGAGRAAGGAVLFCLPLLMTMEMWWIAYYISPLRLASLLLLSLPLFIAVSGIIGFRSGRSLPDNLTDVFVAYAFGFVISFLILFMFNSVSGRLSLAANFTIIVLMAVPATLGALLGRSELGEGEHNPMSPKSYRDELVVLSTGALFLALAVAPTEEIQLIARQMTAWHTLGLFMLTLLSMLAFAVASGKFKSESSLGPSKTLPSILNYCGTVYLISVLVCLFLLWVFGHVDDMVLSELVPMLITLLFPAGLGAAAAKLII